MRSATTRKEFLAELATVKDIVDVVSPCNYYIQQTPPHGLIRKPGAEKVHQALMDAGYKVQPLVGDISGGWVMDWYRETFASDAFVAKAVKEIKEGKLEGLSVSPPPLLPHPHPPPTPTHPEAAGDPRPAATSTTRRTSPAASTTLSPTQPWSPRSRASQAG